MTMMKTFPAPITCKIDGRYVAPGTPITLPADEANRIIEIHGEWAGPPHVPTPGTAERRAYDAMVEKNEQSMRILNSETEQAKLLLDLERAAAATR